MGFPTKSFAYLCKLRISLTLRSINQLIDRSVSDILNLHKYANDFVGKPISIFDSVEITKAINSLNLPPSKLDIGKLTYEYLLVGIHR